MAVRMVDEGFMERLCDAVKAYLHILDEVGTDAIYGHQQRRLEDARSALDAMLKQVERRS